MQTKNGSDSPVVDVAAALRLIDNDRDLYHELIQIYLSTAPEQIILLKNKLDLGDVAGSGHIVHTLKSSSRSMGSRVLGDAAEQMERALVKGDLALARGLFAQTERLFAAVRSELMRIADSALS